MQDKPINQKIFCTTREASEMLSISLRTAQLWTESGLLEAWKTDGGHRRITRQSIERLLTNPSSQKVQKNSVRAEKIEAVEAKDLEILKVLLVEDDIPLRRLYEINLRNWTLPISLSTALNGFEALVRIGQVRPDILITDLHMPGMDGFRMLYTICSMPELAEIKKIVVSGLSTAEIKGHGGIPEGIPVFPKPIPFDKIKEVAEIEAAQRQRMMKKEKS